MGEGLVPGLEDFLKKKVQIPEGFTRFRTHTGVAIDLPTQKIENITNLKTLVEYVKAYSQNKDEEVYNFVKSLLEYNGRVVNSIKAGTKKFEIEITIQYKDGKREFLKEAFGAGDTIDISNIKLPSLKNSNLIDLKYNIYGKELLGNYGL